MGKLTISMAIFHSDITNCYKVPFTNDHVWDRMCHASQGGAGAPDTPTGAPSAALLAFAMGIPHGMGKAHPQMGEKDPLLGSKV